MERLERRLSVVLLGSDGRFVQPRDFSRLLTLQQVCTSIESVLSADLSTVGKDRCVVLAIDDGSPYLSRSLREMIGDNTLDTLILIVFLSPENLTLDSEEVNFYNRWKEFGVSCGFVLSRNSSNDVIVDDLGDNMRPEFLYVELRDKRLMLDKPFTSMKHLFKLFD